MRRKRTIAMIGHLLIAAAVSANAGPAPLPKDRKVAEPPVRFDGLEKHPDYVFHLRYHVLYSDTTMIEVKDANAIKLKFKWTDRSPSMTYMALLAMERKEFDRRKKEDSSLKWLEAKADGVLEVKLTPPATTVPLTVKEIPVTTYRIDLKDGKLGAEKVEDKKGDGEKPTGLLPMWTLGIISSLSITWLGIWCVRRGGAHKPGPNTAKP